MIFAYRLGFLFLIVAFWAWAAQQFGGNVVPSPGETLEAAKRLLGEGKLSKALGESLEVYLSGYTLAIICAVPIGVLMGAIKPVGKTLEIYAFALAATPRVAFIPMIIVLLGLGVKAKVFIVFLGALMPILINTYTGILAADMELVEMARSLGTRPVSIFLKVVLPGALPFVIVGLRLGATIGLISTVVAELYTAVSGLGGLLALYGNTFRMAEYFVVVITLSATGVTLTEGLRYLEKRLSRWKPDVNY